MALFNRRMIQLGMPYRFAIAEVIAASSPRSSVRWPKNFGVIFPNVYRLKYDCAATQISPYGHLSDWSMNSFGVQVQISSLHGACRENQDVV